MEEDDLHVHILPVLVQEVLQEVGDCTVLYCTVLYCTVQYCTVLYCTVLYCTVQVARLADHIADTVDQRCDQFMARLQGISQVAILSLSKFCGSFPS